MTDIRLDNLFFERAGRHLLDGISTSFGSGELTAVLGPNGAGKTTLLRCALGLQTPTRGQALIDGRAAVTMSAADRARRIAYLPQVRRLAWPIRVRAAVALGRFAHGVAGARLGPSDRAAIDEALAACDLGDLAGRRTDTLSGGEVARVHCARAFAAQAPLLIADEPIAGLDPLHQYRVLSLMRAFVDDGAGAVVVLHDPALAGRFADRLVFINAGKIVADGSPDETLSDATLRDVYAVRASVSGCGAQRVVRIDGPLNED